MKRGKGSSDFTNNFPRKGGRVDRADQGGRGRARGRGRGRGRERGRGGHRGGWVAQSSNTSFTDLNDLISDELENLSTFSDESMSSIQIHHSEIKSYKTWLKQLSLKNDESKLEGYLKKSISVWNSCWKSSKQLNVEDLKILIVTLSRLPYSSDISPPSLNEIMHAANLIVSTSDEGMKLETSHLITDLVTVSFLLHSGLC